jgi:hypothetical protein
MKKNQFDKKPWNKKNSNIKKWGLNANKKPRG